MAKQKELSLLEKYYNKFNEEHRLPARHGRVEFSTSMHFIHKYIPLGEKIRILDIGAGTGRYSVALKEEGHDVTAVEKVARNLKVREDKHSGVNCWPGDARNLSFLPDRRSRTTPLSAP